MGYHKPLLDRQPGAEFPGPAPAGDSKGLSRVTSKTVPVLDADDNPSFDDEGNPVVSVEVMNRWDPKTHQVAGQL